METSWLSVMASQTFPFPGKTALRGAVAEREVQRRLLAAERVRLTTVADVRRASLALELARERLALLGRLAGLWEQSAGVAQLRYETGEGAQADALRARLEHARLEQRRRRLELEERLQVQALNRLRQRPLDEALATPRRLGELAFPSPPTDEVALAEARARSPELLAARAGVELAVALETLASREALPDLTVAAGIMVRGPLAPMWTVSVGVPLPVSSGPRQTHALAEARALTQAAGRDEASVEQSLTLRTHQRLEAWRALAEVWAVYQHGLLAQAEASAESTLGQYRAGRVSFASVLEPTPGPSPTPTQRSRCSPRAGASPSPRPRCRSPTSAPAPRRVRWASRRCPARGPRASARPTARQCQALAVGLPGACEPWHPAPPPSHQSAAGRSSWWASR